MSKLPAEKVKKCIKQKVQEATDLTDEVKKEAAIVREIFIQQEKEAQDGYARKRKASISRS